MEQLAQRWEQADQRESLRRRDDVAAEGTIGMILSGQWNREVCAISDTFPTMEEDENADHAIPEEGCSDDEADGDKSWRVDQDDIHEQENARGIRAWPDGVVWRLSIRIARRPKARRPTSLDDQVGQATPR